MLFGAGPLTLIIGVPIYLLARKRVKPKPIVAVVFGTIIGLLAALPWGFMANWPLAILAAISGASGGLAFWWIAHDEIARNQARET